MMWSSERQSRGLCPPRSSRKPKHGRNGREMDVKYMWNRKALIKLGRHNLILIGVELMTTMREGQ